jgi:hypothetical protein
LQNSMLQSMSSHWWICFWFKLNQNLSRVFVEFQKLILIFVWKYTSQNKLVLSKPHTQSYSKKLQCLPWCRDSEAPREVHIHTGAWEHPQTQRNVHNSLSCDCPKQLSYPSVWKPMQKWVWRKCSLYSAVEGIICKKELPGSM